MSEKRMPIEAYAGLSWVDVESSNLQKIAHVLDLPEGCEDAGELYVQFHGGRCYRYEDVPVETVEEMLEAASVGSYFSQEIKGVYAATRIVYA